MKLRAKLALLFVILSSIPLAAVGYIVYYHGVLYIDHESAAHLVAVNALKESQLNSWIDDSSIMLRQLAQRPLVRDNASVLVSVDQARPEYTLAYAELLQHHFKPALEENRFTEFFLLSPADGRVLICTHEMHVGRFRDAENYFIHGKQGTYVQNPYYSVGDDRVLMTIGTPVRDRQGQLVAVLGGNVNLDTMSLIMQQRGDPKTSEETYLVNKFNFFVTDPQPGQSLALRRSNHTYGAQEVLHGKDGVAGYVDYRGIPVIGAYRWIPDLEMGIITEIDRSEAFAFTDALGKVMLTACIAAIVLAGTGGIFFARTLTSPINRLVEGTDKFASGNLDYRISLKSRDEIGRLAGAFNEMAAKRKRAELDMLEMQTRLVSARIAEEIITGMPDPVVVTDTQGVIIQINRAVTDLFGFGKELIGRPTIVLVAEADRARALEAIKVCTLTGFIKNAEVKMLTRDNRQIPCLVNVAVRKGRDGKPIGTIGVIRDITELKAAREAIDQRTQELERSNLELQRFAYVASHDLQEPLRTIASFLQLLEQRYQPKLDNDAREFIDFAVNAANRLKIMIEGLLEYSRVATRGGDFERINAESILEEAAGNLQVYIEESGAEITHSDLPPVSGDRRQLVRVFQNLLANAIRYHGAEPPRVHVSAALQNGACVFAVQDNGIGIEPQYHERIFSIFQRLHGREVPGIGLGLSVAKRIVERHGGRIWVESDAGRGSTFFFTIPVKEATANENA